jgi:hypothetical protein
VVAETPHKEQDCGRTNGIAILSDKRVELSTEHAADTRALDADTIQVDSVTWRFAVILAINEIRMKTESEARWHGFCPFISAGFRGGVSGLGDIHNSCTLHLRKKPDRYVRQTSR